MTIRFRNRRESLEKLALLKFGIDEYDYIVDWSGARVRDNQGNEIKVEELYTVIQANGITSFFKKSVAPKQGFKPGRSLLFVLCLFFWVSLKAQNLSDSCVSMEFDKGFREIERLAQKLDSLPSGNDPRRPALRGEYINKYIALAHGKRTLFEDLLIYNTSPAEVDTFVEFRIFKQAKKIAENMDPSFKYADVAMKKNPYSILNFILKQEKSIAQCSFEELYLLLTAAEFIIMSSGEEPTEKVIELNQDGYKRLKELAMESNCYYHYRALKDYVPEWEEKWLNKKLKR